MSVNYSLWHQEALAETVIENLKHNNFDAAYFSTADEALHYVSAMITPGMKVAFGGSMTVRQLDLRQCVLKNGASIIDHNAPGLSDEEKMTVMRQQLTSDLFISSTNAITTDGCLINVDGNGNRVAAMIFGPKKVVILAGMNKIVHSEEEAFNRIRHVAAPMNMKRLSRKTPCGADGICHDCSSAERGCRAYTIIRKRPSLTPTEVILIGEMMGM
jgi:L-lactate utilization protein LutB